MDVLVHMEVIVGYNPPSIGATPKSKQPLNKG